MAPQSLSSSGVSRIRLRVHALPHCDPQRTAEYVAGHVEPSSRKERAMTINPQIAVGKKQSISILDYIRFRFAFRDDGQVLVETALVLPIFLLIVTGTLIFGIFTMQMMSLTEGVSNAGRVLSVNAGTTLDPCSLAATSVQNASPGVNSANLSYSITLTPAVGGTSTTYSGATCSSTSTTTGAAGNLKSGGIVTITATYTGCSLKYFGANLTPSGCSMSKSITESVQ
jgi:Flp pilus assembly protein TadG